MKKVKLRTAVDPATGLYKIIARRYKEAKWKRWSKLLYGDVETCEKVRNNLVALYSNEYELG